MATIKICDYLKALTDDAALVTLAEKAIEGITQISPCICNPPCRELNDQEKQSLQLNVNMKIRSIEAKKNQMTLGDMCFHVSKHIKQQSGKDISPEEVFNSSPTHDMSHYLELYEESVYCLGYDFYGRPALEYFEERLMSVIDKPECKMLAIRYQKAVAAIEEIIKKQKGT
jgi:hypothetical protein